MPTPEEQVIALTEQLKQLTIERDTLKTDKVNLTTQIGTFQTNLKQKDESLKELGTKFEEANKSVAELGPTKKSLETLTGRYQKNLSVRLKSMGLGDEVLKDQSIEQLEAMEVALRARPAGAANPPQNNNGNGNGNGTGNTPKNKFEADLEIINRAKQRKAPVS